MVFLWFSNNFLQLQGLVSPTTDSWQVPAGCRPWEGGQPSRWLHETWGAHTVSQHLIILRLPPRRNWNVPDVPYVHCDARDMEILNHIWGANFQYMVNFETRKTQLPGGVFRHAPPKKGKNNGASSCTKLEIWDPRRFVANDSNGFYCILNRENI